VVLVLIYMMLAGLFRSYLQPVVVMAAIPMVQLAITEKLHPFDAQFPAVALRGLAISLAAGTAAVLADLLPDALSLPLLGLIAAASIWAALRFALPLADRMSLWLGKLQVDIIHAGRGHTKGDTIVWLPEERALVPPICGSCSRTKICRPASDAVSAAVNPPTPLPRTTRSVLCSLLSLISNSCMF